ncbi:hypothetical protein ACAX46_003444 [Providencia rettgeri]
MQIKVAGVFCYKDENQFNEFKELFTDSHILPSNYSDWKSLTNKLIDKYKNTDTKIIEVYTDTNEFSVWCSSTGNNVDASGRKAFANMKAIQHARTLS